MRDHKRLKEAGKLRFFWAGCIVTLDAMGCQKQIAREIIKADADSVLALKGNQPAAHEEISRRKCAGLDNAYLLQILGIR